MEDHILLHETAYLYSLWNDGFLAIKEGSVGKYGHTDCFGQPIHDAYFSFRTRGYRQIQDTPGVVYNATVWLVERDDQLAKNILLEYENQMISLLEEKIENHRRKVSILKGESL